MIKRALSISEDFIGLTVRFMKSSHDNWENVLICAHRSVRLRCFFFPRMLVYGLTLMETRHESSFNCESGQNCVAAGVPETRLSLEGRDSGLRGRASRSGMGRGVQSLGPCGKGLRGFESHPPHHFTGKYKYPFPHRFRRFPWGKLNRSSSGQSMCTCRL